MQDKNGRAPLHMAAWNGHRDCLDALLDKGANVNVQDKNEGTPLHIAAWNGHRDCLDFLLTRGADVNWKDNVGRPPLHWAAQEGHLACLGALVASGADVEVKDNAENTPLYLANSKGHAACARYLKSLSPRGQKLRGEKLEAAVNGEKCSICYEKMTENGLVQPMMCCHVFHYTCLSNWINSNGKENERCPMCMAPVTLQSIVGYRVF